LALPKNVESDPEMNVDDELEKTLEVELDIARIDPSVKLPAAAKLSACAVADAIKLASEQVCDCASCCETCVPTMLNDMLSPLFCFAMFCCSVVRVATVALVFVSAAGRVNVQTRLGGGNWPPGRMVADNWPGVLTPEKFAAVIPALCKAASTSSRPVLRLAWTLIPKIA
jgi:hypothetical protein